MDRPKHPPIAKPVFAGRFGLIEIAVMSATDSPLPFMENLAAMLSHKNIPAAIVEASFFQIEKKPLPYSRLDGNGASLLSRDLAGANKKFTAPCFFEDCPIVLIEGLYEGAENMIEIGSATDTSIKKRLAIKNPNETAAALLFIESLIQTKKDETPLNGLILAGGKSTRMGQNKALLDYRGQDQITWGQNLLRPFCSEVFLSCQYDSDYPAHDLPKIADRFLGLGPLSGILSAFYHNPNRAWLVIACDLPFLDAALLSELTQKRNPLKLATAIQAEGNPFSEPLICIYEPQAYKRLLDMLAWGYNCPRKMLLNSQTETVMLKEAGKIQNINDRAEREEAKRRLGSIR